MNKVYLLLGSNMEDPAFQLTKAAEKINEQIGGIKRFSSIYRTAAWGNTAQPDFLNSIVEIETTFSAAEILEKIFLIEKNAGRLRTIKNAPRVIDIDILFFNNDMIKTPSLTVPHPEIANRRFVLEPLSEIAASLIHPGLQLSVKKLLQACKDKLNVQKI